MFFIFIAARTFYRKIYPSEEGFNIIDYRNGTMTHVYTNNDSSTQILVTDDDDDDDEGNYDDTEVASDVVAFEPS
jgi:hypothetical protein